MYYRGMPVAVKQFSKHLATAFNVIKEASLMKQLDHPCFPFVYGICTESKPYLLVMQFCSVEGEGYTLHRALQSHTLFLKKQEWVDVTRQLLEAFKLLHSSCLIHQDIKGDNILITYNNTMFVPVIIDFGKCIRKLDACRKVLSKEEQKKYKQKYKHSKYLCQMSLILPSLLYLLGKFVNLKRDNFMKFAVCPQCASLYNLESCTRLVGGQIVSNICSHRPFNKGCNRECGTALARKLILASGKVCFYPHKIYCFNSVIDQVERLLKRPGVPEMCEQWHERQVDDNIVADFYDGSIWRDFLKYKGTDFLNAPRNLAFAINHPRDGMTDLWELFT